MNTESWLRRSTVSLNNSGIPTARLDALILLEYVTGHDRAWLLANAKEQVSAEQLERLKKLLKRRSLHEPLAYIRGKTEFYGREFLLTADVLVPRPESETMIDLFKELVRSSYPNTKNLLIADLGTGSGALGITAYLEVPSSKVDLLEIDLKALKVARINVDKFTLGIRCIHSDLLNKTTSKYDILLCNLPYVTDDFQINMAAKHEPKLAIFGGLDGLDVYRQLFIQLKERSNKPLYILSEAMPPQHSKLAEIAETANYKLTKSHDFIQLFRYEI